MKSITEQLIVSIFLVDLILGTALTASGVKMTFVDPKYGWITICVGLLLLFSCWAMWQIPEYYHKGKNGAK